MNNWTKTCIVNVNSCQQKLLSTLLQKAIQYRVQKVFFVFKGPPGLPGAAGEDGLPGAKVESSITVEQQYSNLTL